MLQWQINHCLLAHCGPAANSLQSPGLPKRLLDQLRAIKPIILALRGLPGNPRNDPQKHNRDHPVNLPHPNPLNLHLLPCLRRQHHQLSLRSVHL